MGTTWIRDASIRPQGPRQTRNGYGALARAGSKSTRGLANDNIWFAPEVSTGPGLLDCGLRQYIRPLSETRRFRAMMGSARPGPHN